MNKAKSKGWAIVFVSDLDREARYIYTGWWLTRREAIRDHVRDTGKPWQYHRSKGDRAVKIEIRELNGPAAIEKGEG